MKRSSTTTLDWASLSEVVSGLLIEGRIAPSAIRPESLIEPYTVLPKILAGKKVSGQEKIIQAIGPLNYQTAKQAAKAINGMAPANWINMLEESANRHEAGRVLEQYAERLKRGEDVDPGPLRSLVARIDKREAMLVPLDKIKGDVPDYVKTGYQPIDTYIGGFPVASTTLVLGPPGTGKTYFFCKIASCYATRGKKVVLLSLEMTMQQLAKRLIQHVKVPVKYRNNILIGDHSMGIGDILAVVAQYEDADLIAVDFAEQILDNDSSEATASFIHRSLANIAKDLRKEILILAQMTKASIYNNELPYLGSARYSGAADQMTALELGLYNPSAIYLGRPSSGQRRDNDKEPVVVLNPGHGGIVGIKARYGFAMGNPAVIEVPFGQGTGWGDKARGVIPL